MNIYNRYLTLLEDTQEESLALLSAWASINSHSENLKGLAQMCETLKKSFSTLGGSIETLSLPTRMVLSKNGKKSEQQLGRVLSIKKRPEAPIQLLLVGHMDTVFPLHSPFQQVTINKEYMYGPGVCDMKGGLVILYQALKVLESTPFAHTIGWKVLITPDEEIGSVSSKQLLIEHAKQCAVGLVFEPALPNGALVSSRKGSINFTLTAKGKAAHAGRHFQKGKNAIIALAKCVTELDALNDTEDTLTLNVGTISGGIARNIVPDFAICLCNARANDEKTLHNLKQSIQTLVTSLSRPDLILDWEIVTERPPKPFDPQTRELFDAFESSAKILEMNLRKEPTGGVCDGNFLAHAGLPTLDTLGVCGDHIHTEQERMLIKSLTSRTKLVALYLMRLANGELNCPKRDKL